ncbi:MAG: hypothetical protein UY41_C0017G0016 [Candidatus Moranbacteria bacterium GW2011_GWE1_49_15]|nr:MAG: hypothetical protein UX75_C0017G0015 [Candidatus Moranbacteria bacterium GW2011_GWE2_47_10]KKW06704.1 MAG: hypothetical protein UY41_C0017G0016 [Candidatus Moranbacteria bacterium GW2011_GWE1_49_15]HBP00754.1 hypothetical protein [Candidatus Moranbacteria bacterium]
MKSAIKKILKVAALAFASLTTIALLAFAYVNLPVSLPKEEAKLGVTFSIRYAQDIGLDWKEAYLATLDDLGVKRIRVPAYWDSIEKEDGEYDWADLDWQLDEAKKRNAEVVLAVGQKVPRWPECYVPKWIGEDDAKRKEKLVMFVEETVGRYKDHEAVKIWQIENEPFLKFGVCPAFDVELLDREIETARSIDPETPIMLTDSGELSLWVPAAKRGDHFGTTMYREVITKEYGAWKYPIGPNFFKAKKLLVRIFASQKNVAVIELQGEPWIEGWTTNFPLERQFQSMDAAKLKENIEFARKTGITDIYVWGVEWWYWLKATQNSPEVWDQAKRLYN